MFFWIKRNSFKILTTGIIPTSVTLVICETTSGTLWSILPILILALILPLIVVLLLVVILPASVVVFGPVLISIIVLLTGILLVLVLRALTCDPAELEGYQA